LSSWVIPCADFRPWLGCFRRFVCVGHWGLTDGLAQHVFGVGDRLAFRWALAWCSARPSKLIPATATACRRSQRRPALIFRQPLMVVTAGQLALAFPACQWWNSAPAFLKFGSVFRRSTSSCPFAITEVCHSGCGRRLAAMNYTANRRLTTLQQLPRRRPETMTNPTPNNAGSTTGLLGGARAALTDASVCLCVRGWLVGGGLGWGLGGSEGEFRTLQPNYERPGWSAFRSERPAARRRRVRLFSSQAAPWEPCDAT